MNFTWEDAKAVAEEILKIPAGMREYVWKTPMGLQFSAPITPGTTLTGEDPQGWEFLGTITGPGPDCSDIGFDPQYAPCYGRTRWTAITLLEYAEIIQILADDIYENSAWWGLTVERD